MKAVRLIDGYYMIRERALSRFQEIPIMELMLVGQLFLWLVTWVVLQVYFENRQRRSGENQQRTGEEIRDDA